MKKTMKRKLITATVCMALTVSTFMTANVSAKDEQEITVAIWNADEAFAGDEVLSTIEKKIGVKIIPMNITWDDYLQKIPLWASSGSLPDVL